MGAQTVTLSSVKSAQLNQLVNEGVFSSTEEAVEKLLAQILDDSPAVPYSPETLALFHERMAQADRGEFVSQEEVETFFEDWRRNG